ncbi:PREDICTED: mitochondrial peptide methionine sulfoxide reductase [Fulmarus glacialis]|uniref:mitochondrial peptide methionine sulfoxide reductase n=1 Tax=Fulmarus glacialis TaxID=30455 RepID=UPI00051B7C60|nr:PREDICTED: mitochondrial peptide methionine sulfoxide reductase [Fulmarus glacialis]
MQYSGMGCFWGAERKFWRQKGVYSTQVGYAGGYTPNPTYKEVCSGKTGHTETVRVVYQPENISFEKLLKVFWENHDPTQGMRQGNDFGTQYRSAIYTFSQEQMEAALRSKEEYQKPFCQFSTSESKFFLGQQHRGPVKCARAVGSVRAPEDTLQPCPRQRLQVPAQGRALLGGEPQRVRWRCSRRFAMSGEAAGSGPRSVLDGLAVFASGCKSSGGL